jgi:2-oxoglutarate ferredoxin oxidoreductase subunit gamma
MENRLTIAGSGGQGVMLIGQLLSLAAWEAGKQVSFFPTYGPQQRGGVSSCRIVFSDEAIFNTKPNIVDIFIGLNEEGVLHYGSRLKLEGILLLNSSQAHTVAGMRAEVYEIEADRIALELGNPKSANMVMLGAYLGISGSVQVDTVMENLREMFGERRANLLPINREAIERGVACVKGQRG